MSCIDLSQRSRFEDAARFWKELIVVDEVTPLSDFADIEPTADELAEIEREWPLIDTELELLNVQLSILNGTGHVNDVEVRRLRHAQQAVIREALAWYQARTASRRATEQRTALAVA